MSIARTGPSRPLRSPCVALVLTVFSALALGACGGTTSADVATRAPAAKAASDGADHPKAGQEAQAPADGADGAAEATTTEADDGRDPVLGDGKPVTIAFAGDMNFEGATASRLDADPNSVFGPVLSLIHI